MKKKLVVVGAAGRMGRRVLTLASESQRFQIVGAVETHGHPDTGKDAGTIAGIERLDIVLDASWPAQADVAIDFSLPEAAETTIENCRNRGIGLVMGTTGLSPRQRDDLTAAAKEIPVLYGANMSVGMNVLFALVGRVAAMLGQEYDIEIIEQHHRFKKDAPSGTALTLAEKICEATDRRCPDSLTHGRSGKDALRHKGEIGVHAIRAGDITGVHSVICSTLGETVTLNHTAHSRDTFVRGALRAAEWLAERGPGLYTMGDVLGIE